MDLLRLPAVLLYCLLYLTLSSTASHAVPVSAQGTWETTLFARDLDGNPGTIEAYWDSVLDITWLANANYANTTMNWSTATSWAAGLDLDGVPGPDGWRLPNTVDVGNDGGTYTNIYQGVDYGYNITTQSEMSHMYYVTLGNTAAYDTSGVANGCGSTAPDYCLSNTGPFSNIQPAFYYSATVFAPDNNLAWNFDFASGYQDADNKNRYAWAVHQGDFGTAVVPLPAAVWLFGSGLLVLMGVVSRRG